MVKQKQIESSDNEEYRLAKQLMTIPRFCGLLQSDGHFTATYDKQKVQNPKIILTQTNKRLNWLQGVKDWLLEKGIKSNLYSPSGESNSSNLTIDRANCRHLISLIEEEERVNQTLLLFDNKRVSYLLLKESIRIKQSSNQKSLTEEQAAMLVDIKESGLKRGKGPKGLTKKQLIERLGFPKMETTGRANFLIQEIKQKVEACGAEELKAVLENPKEIKPALGDFIAGVFDGDGSITVGLFTHLSKDGKKLTNRHTFEIVPAINVTTEKEEKGYLLNIINAAFGKGRQIRLTNVNVSKDKGVRLVIKSAKVLKEYIVPFFERYQPSLLKNRIRFETFRAVLEELPLNYQNKERVIELVREIYAKDLYERDKPLEVFLKIVELDYN